MSASQVGDGHPKYAIVIGVDQWLPHAGLPVLRGAINDANSIAARLQDVKYKVVLMTPECDASHIPSHANILNQIAYLSQISHGAGSGVLVVYYSGHGVARNGKAYLMPSDGLVNAPDLTGLTLENIVTMINREGGRFDSLLLVTDACRFGAEATSTGFLTNLTSAAKNWAIISACGPGEGAYEADPEAEASSNDVVEDRQPMGVFTAGLNKVRYFVADDHTTTCAADRNRDGIVSWREALPAARDAVARFQQIKGPTNAAAASHPHVPQILAEGTALSAPFCLPEPLLLRTNSAPRPPAPIRLSDGDVFWLYTNYSRSMFMPLKPSGWMTGGTEDCDQNRDLGFLDQMMRFNVKCTNAPFGGKGSCIDWQVFWSGRTPEGQPWNQAWAGVAWIAGPTLPLWWASEGDERGHYYDLRQYRCLMFQARAGRPGTRVQVKIGPLCRDCAGHPLRNGDSLSYPIFREFELGTNWQQCVVPLTPPRLPPGHVCPTNLPPGKLCPTCGGKPNDLSRVCSLAFVVVRGEQPDPEVPLEVWLDDVGFAHRPPSGPETGIPSAFLPRGGADLWVYSDFSQVMPMPLKAYGWMSGGAGDPCDTKRDRAFLDQMMRLDPKCVTTPFGGKGTCIDWQVFWSGTTSEAVAWDEGWAAVGFFAGRTLPPWWAEPWDADGGQYYDLRGFKYLVLWARAALPECVIRVKVAPLSRDCAGKPLRNGDSLSYPIERAFTIGTNWTRCVLPLTPISLKGTNHTACLKAGAPPCPECGNKPNDLSRICSLSIGVDRGEQSPSAGGQTQMWLDAIRFTREKPIE